MNLAGRGAALLSRGVALTDVEFEELNTELLRLMKSGSRKTRRYKDLTRRRACCRDCGREEPEFYMLRGALWRKAVPRGGGVLCLACLAPRLGRRRVPADFVTAPCDIATGDEIALR